MEPTDVTIEILKSIRDELHDGLSSVREELSGVRRALSHRVDDHERRLADVEKRVGV
jgi:hypothetical protein